MRRLEAGENTTSEPKETGRGCREKKRKVSTSDSADEDDEKDLPVNICTILCWFSFQTYILEQINN